VAGPTLDKFVSERVLAALEPAALELSPEAAKHFEREREDLEKPWWQRLERATHEAERAARQYQLVEPEHRLVVRQLEREWEEKLAAKTQLEEEHYRFEHNQPRLLTEAEQEAIRALAADIPSLCTAATTTDAERKEIIRQVVERVVVEALGHSERVRVVIEWVGGTHTQGNLIRSVTRLDQLSYY
jgi:hypothetical protein